MSAVIYYFNTLYLNKKSGGVIQFSERLLAGLRKISNVVSLGELPVPLVGQLLQKIFGRFGVEEYLSVTSDFTNATSIFFPNYYLPILLPKKYCNKSVVVVHDLQYKFYPEYFSRKKIFWLNFCYRRIYKFAGAIVFISEASKKDFVKFFGSRDNMFVIYNPVPDSLAPASIVSVDFNKSFLLASYNFYPHKNFIGLINYFLKLKLAGYGGDLYITGGGRDQVEFVLAGIDIEFRCFIKHLGYVSDSMLASLQARCDAFISLSEFEGFNLPAAECACVGTPLILSDILVHRELFSDYAFFANNYTEISGCIEYMRSSKNKVWKYKDLCEINCVASQYLSVASKVFNEKNI